MLDYKGGEIKLEATKIRISNQAGNWERFCRRLYQGVDLTNEARLARRACRRQLAKIKGGLRGSRFKYKKEVVKYWSRYGIKPKKMWFDLYCFSEGKYDPRYIPEELYWTKIYPALNHVSFRNAYTDKCFYRQLFPYLKHPRTFIKNVNNCFYDSNGNAIDIGTAAELLLSEDQFVIKPAIHSGEGVDIFFYDKQSDCNIDLTGLLLNYKSNFIVQENVQQHPTLSLLHKESLNTIRTISFLYRGEVHISSSILRMGISGSRLDNFSAGGLACPINTEGQLTKYAVDRLSCRYSQHPGGTVFENLSIPSYDRILDSIRRAHRDIPHFRIIGWDFTVDESGDPVFIEYNGGPALNQISCGPLFGDLTESVLNTIFLGAPEF